MNFKHLRTSITLVTSLLTILIFISFGAITFNLNRSLINKNIETIHKEITNKVLLKLDSYLSTPRVINDLNDAFIEINDKKINNLDQLRTFFYKQMSIFKSVNLIAFGTEEGSYVEAQRMKDGRIRTGSVNKGNLELYTTDLSGQKLKLENIVSNYDPRLRPWYETSKDTNFPSWSDIYLFASNNQPAISENQPYYHKGSIFTGVLTTSVTLEGISNFLSRLSVSNDSSVLVMEPSGLTIATSKGIPLIDSLSNRITGSHLDDPIFSTIAKTFDADIEGNYTNLVSEFSVLIDKVKYLVRSTPFVYNFMDIQRKN